MNIEEIGRKALEYDKFSGCSQAVLLALQEAFKIGDEKSFKSATVISGGVARRGETCGALIGGLLALGLVVGREDITNTQVYRDAMIPANYIIEDFKK
jgi:C_GCAxxG_C_C family probable redox protein